ncbi:MAG: cytochrome [Alphaproteobacteria bacterium]|nr:cytochrome [Alphaproteobacteria bacterium]
MAQLLHWTTAALILTLIPVGIYMADLPATTADEVAHKSSTYSLHKTLGVAVFMVAIVRIGWAICQPRPQLLNADRPLESLAAHTIHWILYGTIILMPLTGWLYHSATEGFAPIWWPFGQDLPMVPEDPRLASVFQSAHYCTGVLLILSLCLHIAGALKHSLIDRDSTLRRMIPGLKQVPADMELEQKNNRLPLLLSGLIFILLGGTIGGMAYFGDWPGSPPGQRMANTAAASVVDWRVNSKTSRINIEVKVMGKPVTGRFEDWKASINFDPDRIENAAINVDIVVSSLVLGSVRTQALSADFLNSGAHPVARFVSRSVTRVKRDSYTAVGDLLLAGSRRPVTMAFDLSVVGGKVLVQGEVLLNRFEFGIGQKGFPDSSVLDAMVPVRIALEAVKRR